jgi:putative ABC transport system substrate-binding protein
MATILIVLAIGSDPVKFGLVAAFNRPAGNMTGVSWLGGPTLVAKRLQVLHELVPAATVIAVLVNPNNQASRPRRERQRKPLDRSGFR